MEKGYEDVLKKQKVSELINTDTTAEGAVASYTYGNGGSCCTCDGCGYSYCCSDMYRTSDGQCLCYSCYVAWLEDRENGNDTTEPETPVGNGGTCFECDGCHHCCDCSQKYCTPDGKELCYSCYQKWLREQENGDDIIEPETPVGDGGTCFECDGCHHCCDCSQKYCTPDGKELCYSCYQQWLRNQENNDDESNPETPAGDGGTCCECDECHKCFSCSEMHYTPDGRCLCTNCYQNESPPPSIEDTRERVRVHYCIEGGYEFFNLVFSNGVTWKSIGKNLYNLSTTIYGVFWDRYHHNRIVDYTSEQLAFIYRFDPLGVEYYLKHYYLNHEIDEIDCLFFKDEIYEKIFGEKPRCFRELPSDTIQYFTYSYDRSFRNSVYTYAELLFGGHYINDRLARAGYVSDIIMDIVELIPFSEEVEDALETASNAIDLYQVAFMSKSIVESNAASNFIDSYVKQATGNSLDDLMGWPYKLLKLAINLTLDFLDNFAPPNPEDIIIYAKVEDLQYETCFVIEETDVPLSNLINIVNGN